ncbi:hypothetical protein ACRAWD_22845 [Caulobacter segnis]
MARPGPWPPRLSTTPATFTIHQQTYLGAAKIDGPLADLPGGQLKVALGVEYRHETFEQRGIYGGSPVPESLARNIGSVYGEVFVADLWRRPSGADDAQPGALAFRPFTIHYSDFRVDEEPEDRDQLGAGGRPPTLRSTYGRSFRAPGLRDVSATVGAYYYNLPRPSPAAPSTIPLEGPRRSTPCSCWAAIRASSQKRPRPTRSAAGSAPSGPLPNFHASVTFYDIQYTNVIGTPGGARIRLHRPDVRLGDLPQSHGRPVVEPSGDRRTGQLRQGLPADDREIVPDFRQRQFRRPPHQRPRFRRGLSPADQLRRALCEPGRHTTF